MPAHILIIDDSEAIRGVMDMVLSEKGYAVSHAATAEEGLRSIRQRIPDLIILDVELPDMMGTQFCGLLKNDPKGRYIPILMCTSHKAPETGLNFGADDYMSKPFQGGELAARVNALLRRVQLAREEGREEHRRQDLAAPPPAAPARTPHASAPASQPPAGASAAFRPPARSRSLAAYHAVGAWALCAAAARVLEPGAAGFLAALMGLIGPGLVWGGATALCLALASGGKPPWESAAKACSRALAPLALSSALALVYVLITGGPAADFTASPFLLLGLPPRHAWLSRLLSGADAFALWSAWALSANAKTDLALPARRAAAVGAGGWLAWFFWRCAQ